MYPDTVIKKIKKYDKKVAATIRQHSDILDNDSSSHTIKSVLTNIVENYDMPDKQEIDELQDQLIYIDRKDSLNLIENYNFIGRLRNELLTSAHTEKEIIISFKTFDKYVQQFNNYYYNLQAKMFQHAREKLKEDEKRYDYQ